MVAWLDWVLQISGREATQRGIISDSCRCPRIVRRIGMPRLSFRRRLFNGTIRTGSALSVGRATLPDTYLSITFPVISRRQGFPSHKRLLSPSPLDGPLAGKSAPAGAGEGVVLYFDTATPRIRRFAPQGWTPSPGPAGPPSPAKRGRRKQALVRRKPCLLEMTKNVIER
jgi:hypothetical protein